ncbi:hypothetical protein GCM10007938_00740 [Vibrio zhanjiangensis]|uniref:Phage tail protein n=1 Tax=Vibrio zhanjiangensis TaxID=1046128 RepID=A0ABQ6ET27_9VIBR|nr:hypothetical protein GCM10007938_00740 [Vibrio zhanjiangensis]
MKTRAKPYETVNTLLYRVFGVDCDDLEEEFYRLNPTQNTPFLRANQEIELPYLEEDLETTSDDIIVWT